MRNCFPFLRRTVSLLLLTLTGLVGAVLSACDSTPFIATAQARPAVAIDATHDWPGVWSGQTTAADHTPVIFSAPSADDCRRWPTVREVAGDPGGAMNDTERRREHGGLSRHDVPPAAAPLASAKAVGRASESTAVAELALPSTAPVMPKAQPAQRPANEKVTAGMVDDNADFGEFRAYRERSLASGRLLVRDRDVSERQLLQVNDAAGRPVHGQESRLGVAVRKGNSIARTVWSRGQSAALQVQLQDVQTLQRPRLDLVFLVDATGSMGDEIAKLKSSMRAVAAQIAQLPTTPDVCYGLVTYRDRGDAYLTRSHDFTHDLGTFQSALAQAQAAGGGDTPAALNEALHETVHGLSWRRDAVRLVVLVADAPPHLDYCTRPASPQAVCPTYERDMQAALAKGIKLFAVGASGLDPSGEFIFRQMAQYTAGRFVFLTYQNAKDPSSGPGSETVHDVTQYSVQTLDKLIVRLVADELGHLKRG